MLSEPQAALAQLIDRFSKGDGIHDTPVPGIHSIKFSSVSAQLPSVYNPSACVIVQGAKQVLLEDEVYRYAPSQFLVVSVDLPVLGQILEATPERPYLCLQIDLDPRRISDLLSQMDGGVSGAPETARGLFVGEVDAPLLDTVLRLARLMETPQDIPHLAPMITQELYYRLLTGAHGAQIAQAAVAGGKMQRIAQVLRTLRDNFAKPLRIEELAELARMSASSFHFHFKEVTAMSPLQYQKRLRLMEARRILLAGEADAANAAYRVGYESPSQFSREYSRMFGAPPMRDVGALLRSNLQVSVG